MNMPSTSTNKSVSFSETSTLVLFPKCSATSMWYQDSDMESFKESFKRSVVETRYNLSRGDIHGSELLGMEKHLTQDLSREYALRRRTLQSAVLKKQQMYGASASEKEYLSSVVSVQSQWAAERARAAALLLERDLSIST